MLTSLYSMIGDYPGIFSLSDPGEAAWTIWYAESCGADGFLKWAYDAWCQEPLEDNAHPYFEAGDMFLVYPDDYRGKETGVRTTPRFQMLTEAVYDVCKLRQIRQESDRFRDAADRIVSSTVSFYGLGASNGVGTNGFISADDDTKEKLAQEVIRLHQEVVQLSLEYDKEKQRIDFMKAIDLPEAGRQCVLEYEMTETDYQKWKNLFYKEEDAFFRKAETIKEKEKLYLYLYVRFAEDLGTAYKKIGIEDAVYYDTFSDISIWFRHFLRQEGKPGIKEVQWLKLHLKQKLYRFGSLQFEADLNTKSIHVHIPEGTLLETKACEEAFVRAEAFFDGSYGTFDCDSWLLTPALNEMLPEKSRIRSFQKLFQITGVNPESRQSEERVFGAVCEDVSAYPECTTLQRALKKCLSEHKKVGSGFGIRKRRSNEVSPCRI